MMHLTRDFRIACERCGHITLVNAADLFPTENSYEYPMGDMIEYDFHDEFRCQNCQHSWISFLIRGFEYPMNVFNGSDFSCSGGEFLDPPMVEIVFDKYEFDDHYINAAYEQYLAAEAIIEYNRNMIKEMTPNEFEEFVAGIFANLGFSIKITPRTRDGGKDIIATRSDPLPYTLIIECKHWSNKVNVSVVRSVYGVQVDMNANQSLIVTSSKFTRDARLFAEKQQTQMELWDMEDLLKQIQYFPPSLTTN